MKPPTSFSSLFVLIMILSISITFLATPSLAQGPGPEPTTTFDFIGLTPNTEGIHFLMDMRYKMYQQDPLGIYDLTMRFSGITLNSNAYLDVMTNEYDSHNWNITTNKYEFELVSETEVIMKGVTFPRPSLPGSEVKRSIGGLIRGSIDAPYKTEVRCEVEIYSRNLDQVESFVVRVFSFDQPAADKIEVKLTPQYHQRTNTTYDEFTYNITNLNDKIGANLAEMNLSDNSPVDSGLFKIIDKTKPYYCLINEQEVKIEFDVWGRWSNSLPIPRGMIERLGFGDWFIECVNIGLVRDNNNNNNNNDKSSKKISTRGLKEEILDGLNSDCGSKRMNAMKKIITYQLNSSESLGLDDVHTTAATKSPYYFGVKVASKNAQVYNTDLWINRP